jgi:rhomboid domain-containing protein 1
MYLSTCAVGFSAVLFAFKVVLNHDDPTYSSVMGFTLPTKYMAWAELVLASAFNPQASFFGHLCGILAGVVHVRGAAALRSGASGQRLLRRVAAAVARVVGGAHQPRFAGGGVSGRAAPRPPARPVQAQEPPERLPAARLPTSPVPGAMPAAAVGRQAPAVISMGSGHVTGGVAAVSEEELRQRRLARFQR